MVEFKRLRLEKAYDSVLVEAYKDYLLTPAGEEVCFDLLHHKAGGGSGALLVDREENTYLVKLYRNSINRTNLEIPAGAYAFPGEDGKTCALREAEEETGLIPQIMLHVSNMVSSIGTYDETTDVFIGLDLKEGKRKLDPTEYIDVVKLSVEEAFALVLDGTIVDSKTVAALYAYQYLKLAGKLPKI